MLNRIIDFTLAYRWLVLIGIVVLLAGGGYALYTIPVEAFPDLKESANRFCHGLHRIKTH